MGRITRKFRVPWGIVLALFAYWTFYILLRYYRVNPAGLDEFSSSFMPSAPPGEFSWRNITELGDRWFFGNCAVAVWAAGLLGLGLAAGRMIGLSRQDAGSLLVFSLATGMALGSLLWLGLGLNGLIFKSVSRALAAIGCGLAVANIRIIRGAAADSLGRWLIVGLSGQIALVIFLAGAAAANSYAGGGALGLHTAWIWGLVVFGSWAFLSVMRLAGRGSGLLMRFMAVEVLAAILIVAVSCLTPERFYDAQVYHLACPALFAMHHKVIGMPNLMHSSFPLGMHMLYQWQWLLGGEPAVRAWRPWLFILILWTIWKMGEREGRPKTGFMAAGMFAACPLLLTNACQTSIDLEVCLMVLFACLCLRRATAADHPSGAFALGAMFSGAALSMKYTAVFWVPWLFGLVTIHSRRRFFAVKAAIFVAAVACWISPWLFRNWAVVGNPVYPYATRIFSGGRQWEPARKSVFLEQQATYVARKPAELLKLPWLLSTGDDSETYIGPVFLLFAPFLVFFFPSGAAAAYYSKIAGLSILGWIGVTHVHRFLLATWGLLALCVAWAIVDISGRRRFFGGTALLLAVIAGLVNIISVTGILKRFLDPPNLLAGRESISGYLERKMINSYYGAAFRSESFMPALGRVLMVGETRGLYWPRPFINHSVYDMQAFEEAVRDSWNGNEAAKRLRQMGVTHLFFNDIETSRLKIRYGYRLLEFDRRDKGVIADLWAGWMRRVPVPGKYSHVYRLMRSPGRGPAAAQPLSLDEDALRGEFEGFARISWEGGGAIKAEKRSWEREDR